ncbi:acetyl-CoA carboxylase biotin carboxyl carrier protein [Latilactobacillus sakei]|uniref:Biotin carboxyl carrier protein of acetyl-CoA carboxylase n=1 Tax=Latilactobacillus sakei TaxID=1599 RepID=A0AAF0GS95_LATSK|nr:acetyl-CoA carboxylase biotin carboxyl carrier protein [Latilactobacillus sakei]WGI20053.1 acetyl-CoA carboxylase biotin carboxyl carrier protein [Latilactobacillus sakei]
MNYDEVKEMVALFNQSGNQEMQLETSDIKLYLNKRGVQDVQHAPVAPSVTPTTPMTSMPTEAPEAPVAVADDTVAIEAPLVGSIYLQPAPADPAFVKVGQTVAVGDVVCVIEAMKMMTEVKSTVAGTITDILVQNEELVEYQQPLFKVKEG